MKEERRVKQMKQHRIMMLLKQQKEEIKVLKGDLIQTMKQKGKKMILKQK